MQATDLAFEFESKCIKGDSNQPASSFKASFVFRSKFIIDYCFTVSDIGEKVYMNIGKTVTLL